MDDFLPRVQFHLRTRVLFGEGVFASAGGETTALGRTVLIVTGRSAMKRTGVTDKLLALIRAAGGRPVLFDAVSPNPTTDEVDAGAALGRSERVELVIGLGGGSAMDAAKAIAISIPDGRPFRLIYQDPPQKGLPVLAIPTTSGTGSEVNTVAVITDPVERRKIGVRSPGFAPVLAMVDPELAATMPPAVTASSGMDALAHAVESYLTPLSDPFSELFAERAAELALRHLREACGGAGRAARAGMSLASLMAGVALGQAGAALPHGIGMALGGAFGVDHGTVVGLLLPRILAYELPVLAPRLAGMARRIGLAGDGSGDLPAAGALVEEIRRLATDLPLPKDLAALGCHLSGSPDLADEIARQRATKNHPAPLDRSRIEDILCQVFSS